MVLPSPEHKTRHYEFTKALRDHPKPRAALAKRADGFVLLYVEESVSLSRKRRMMDNSKLKLDSAIHHW